MQGGSLLPIKCKETKSKSQAAQSHTGGKTRNRTQISHFFLHSDCIHSVHACVLGAGALTQEDIKRITPNTINQMDLTRAFLLNHAFIL